MALYMLQAQTEPAATYSFWADVLLRGGFVDSALRLALAGADMVGLDGSLENAIGNILSKQGKWLEANSHYEASLSAGRSDGWPELNLAKNFVALQQFHSAESWFRRALTKRDEARSLREFAGYLNEFAWFIANRRKDDSMKVREALAMSREANELVKRSDPNFLDTLAECESAAGNHSAAVDAARAALALVGPASPERPEYERRLAEFEARAKR
jgi:tetratricopeptide (TPR) repeat protein